MHTACSLTVSRSVCRGACVPHMPPTMHTPLPCMPLPHMPPTTHVPAMHAPCHACPLQCMTPCHACPLPCIPLPCMPPCHAFPPTMHAPTMHAPLPCMPPCHACPPAMHVPWHACPLPCTPPATHTPATHAPHLPHIPPTTHAPLHMPPRQNSWHTLVKTYWWYLMKSKIRALITHLVKLTIPLVSYMGYACYCQQMYSKDVSTKQQSQFVTYGVQQ